MFTGQTTSRDVVPVLRPAAPRLIGALVGTQECPRDA